jgi:hypothetical protein
MTKYNQQLADRITQFLQENLSYYTAAEIAQALSVPDDLELYSVLSKMLFCDELWSGSDGKMIQAYKYREPSTVMRSYFDLFPSEFKVS